MAAQQQTNPMFGRPIWTYSNVIRGPVAGPQPRLAAGTGLTGRHAAPGTAAQLPGYVSDNSYEMSPFTYQPPLNDNFQQSIPRTIGSGENGREVVGTYNPHDFTPGQRWNHQKRSAPNWQIMAFGPKFRNLQAWQQVARYRTKTPTISAMPLTANNYFLGYQIQPEVQGLIGQSSLGYMGSV